MSALIWTWHVWMVMQIPKRWEPEGSNSDQCISMWGITRWWSLWLLTNWSKSWGVTQGPSHNLGDTCGDQHKTRWVLTVQTIHLRISRFWWSHMDVSIQVIDKPHVWTTQITDMKGRTITTNLNRKNCVSSMIMLYQHSFGMMRPKIDTGVAHREHVVPWAWGIETRWSFFACSAQRRAFRQSWLKNFLATELQATPTGPAWGCFLPILIQLHWDPDQREAAEKNWPHIWLHDGRKHLKHCGPWQHRCGHA